MGKFKRAAVLGATILAFSGAAAGAAQASTQTQDQTIETPGNVATDCHSAKTQQLMNSMDDREVVIDSCDQEAVGAGETPTMVVHYHYA